MPCPMFIDFTRECVSKNSFVPGNTFGYCQNEMYKDCPFFKVINGLGDNCEFIIQCQLYKDLGMQHFTEFKEVADKYCLKDYRSCERYKMRKSGIMPPKNLYPDGTIRQ